MVKLEEVEDEELNQAQPGPIEDSDDDYVDTDSSLSDNEDDDDTVPSESLSERLSALKDIIPPLTRRRLGSTLNNTLSVSKTAGLWGGKAIWTIVASGLLVIVPFTIALFEEQQYLEQEREMKAQEGLREGVTPGVSAGERTGAGPTL